MKSIWKFVKDLFNAYIADNALQLGAALAYYTVFSFAPVIVIVIAVASLFLGREAVQGEIFHQLQGLLGANAASQAQQIIENAYLSGQSRLATIISAVTLFIGATGVFAELKNDLNIIWEMKAKPRNGILNFIFNRVLSFGMVLTIGFLLLISLVWDTVAAALSDRLTRYMTETAAVFVFILNIVISLSLTTLLFAIIFRVLPDARIKWRDVLVGSLFTAILFMAGKYLIGFYIGNSNISNTFGTAGVVAVILIWAYYASQILFLGAEFTWVYAKRYGSGIRPNAHAVHVVRKEIEKSDRAAEHSTVEEKIENKKA